ncbi:hypothetical protein AO382_1633 [Moraxella catarrhalis]|uniref:Uncharacterized protein n=1 Tax=Moraxella catarrhalis TaxID=480 RepID=A0A7Z1A3I0_MORCA|nr:hypothetical protein AO382_1633 [Moraxella catarrhalis]
MNSIKITQGYIDNFYIHRVGLVFHNDLTYFVDKIVDKFLSGQILAQKSSFFIIAL